MPRTLVMVIRVPFNNRVLVNLKAMAKDMEHSLPDKRKNGKAMYSENQQLLQFKREIGKRQLLRRLKERLDSMVIPMSPIGTKKAL